MADSATNNWWAKDFNTSFWVLRNWDEFFSPHIFAILQSKQ